MVNQVEETASEAKTRNANLETLLKSSVKPQIPNPRPQTLNQALPVSANPASPQTPNLNLQTSKLGTLTPEPRDAGQVVGSPDARNPKPETRNSSPEPRTPNPETRNPKPETRNPKPDTRNPKPENRNPKPETRNRCSRHRSTPAPKPQTLSPKPHTLNPTPGGSLSRTNASVLVDTAAGVNP